MRMGIEQWTERVVSGEKELKERKASGKREAGGKKGMWEEVKGVKGEVVAARGAPVRK